MKIFFSSFFLAFLFSYIPSLAQDTDTVWTHDLWRYKVKGSCARFMPDGKSIIAGVNNTIYEFETATGKLMRKFESMANSNLSSLSIIQDGKIIIAKTKNYNFVSWDYTLGKYNGAISYHDSTKNPASSYAIKPMENKIYFLVNDSIVLFDLVLNKTERIGYLPAISFDNIATSNDGKFLALTYIYLNPYDQLYHSKLYLYDALNWKIIRELDDITRDVLSIAFSPNSKYVAFTTSQNDGTFLRLYDLENNKSQIYPRGFFGFEPWSINFTNDEKYVLVSGGYRSISKLIQIETSKCIYTINHGAEQEMIDINSANQIIYNEVGNIALINSNWFTTDVSANEAIIYPGNLSLLYSDKQIIIKNIDNEIIKLVNVFDINGKLIKTYEAGYTGSNIELPFSTASGVYLVRVVTEDKDYGFKITVGE